MSAGNRKYPYRPRVEQPKPVNYKYAWLLSGLVVAGMGIGILWGAR